MSAGPAVVLVPPATSLVNAWKNQHVPVGLLLLGALLERDGVSVRIHSGALYFPDDEAADAAAQALLAPGDVAVLGVSAWCHTLPAQLTLVRAVKRRAPQVTVVFGGPQATATGPALLDAFPAVDLVLTGEAEASFPALVQALLAGEPLDEVPGLLRRGPEGLLEGPPVTPRLTLDDLPPPALHLAPPSPIATVESGRGCPWACRFCSTSAFFARRHRARGVDALLAELQHLYRQHGVRHVTFTDDIFTVDKRWARAFCEAMVQRGPPLAWGCSTRIDCVDPELLALMAQARCDSVLYGVETGSPALQRAMGKRLKIERVEPTVQATRAVGIRAYCTFIYGFPEETPEDLAQSFALAWRLLSQGVHVTAQTLCVLPDTPYFNEHFDKLRFDGFSSLSRAALSPAERGAVQAHPALFSSFFYLESPAAPRALLVAAMHLSNLLRQFPHTCTRLGAHPGDPFSRLAAWHAADRLPPVHADFDPTGAALLGEWLAEVGDGELGAVYALEAAALHARKRLLDPSQPHGLQWRPGVFLHRSAVDLPRVLAGQPAAARAGAWLVQLDGDLGLSLQPLARRHGEALAAMPLGGDRAQAQRALEAQLPGEGATLLAGLLAGGALQGP